MTVPFSIPMTVPGYQNIIIPGYMGDAEAQSKLLIGYALDEDTISLNQWITIFGTNANRAYYPIFNSSDFVRFPDTTGDERRWADGAPRPPAMQGVRFTNKEFQLERYGESVPIGNMAEEYSQIGSLVTLNQEFLASRALVWRTIVATSSLTNAANYFVTSPTPTVYDNYFANWTTMTTALTGASKPYPTGWFGTNMYAGTIAAPVFKRFLAHASQEIRRRTNGRVKISDLLFLVNPITAAKLAATEEFHAYQANQAGSLRVLKGDEPEFVEPVYGLPQPTYNIRAVADATCYTSGSPIMSDTDADYGQQTYVIPNDFIAVLARPGSVAGMAGSRGFSSLVLFQNEQRALKPTTFPDVRSQLVEVAVEDMFTTDVVAPDCCFVLGSVLAA